MSGRIYDIGDKAICLKCGGPAYLSAERNFHGPQCKNSKCGSRDVKYIPHWYGFECCYFKKQDGIVNFRIY